MLNRFFSELLVLLLLLIATSRFLYIKKVKTDPLCILPLIAFLISILNMVAFGVSLFEMILFLLSFFITIWNTRALLRFTANMVIDHYGFWFVFISTINLLITLAVFGIIIYFRPVYVSEKKFNLQTQTERYTGSLADGFYKSDKMFSKKTAIFHTYCPLIEEKPEESKEIVNVFKTNETNQPKNIIIFLPSLASTTDTYLPMFAKLALDGYTVYSADFCSSDITFFENFRDNQFLRTICAINLKTRNPKEYQEMIEANTATFYLEYEALLDFANINEGDFVYLAGDEDSAKAMEAIKKYHSDVVKGFYDLSETEGYTTPGFGPIEQTNPFNANYLGFKRDKTLYMSSHIATSLENHFKDAKALYELKLQSMEHPDILDLGENELE